MKYPYSFFLLITTALISPSLLLAGEVNLTTYYPAPSGNYDTLTVNNDLTSSGNTTLSGTTTASIFTVTGSTTLNGETTLNNTARFRDLSIGPIGIERDPNDSTGIRFSQSGQSLFFIGGRNVGIAIPAGKNLVLEGGKLIMGSYVSTSQQSPFLIDLGFTTGDVGSIQAKKLALHNHGRGHFYGFGIAEGMMEFHVDNEHDNGYPQMILNKDGNLGIGGSWTPDNLPIHTLDVKGDIASTGAITSSTQLTVLKSNGTSATTIDNIGNITSTGKIKGAIVLPTSQPANLENGMMWLE